MNDFLKVQRGKKNILCVINISIVKYTYFYFHLKNNLYITYKMLLQINLSLVLLKSFPLTKTLNLLQSLNKYFMGSNLCTFFKKISFLVPSKHFTR